MAKRFRKRARKYGRKTMRKKRSIKRKDGLAPFKLTGVVDLTSDAANQIQHTVSLTNPGAYYDGSGALPDLSSLTSLYDQARICAIKIKYIPRVPNDLASYAAYVPLYIVRDDDDTSLPSSVSEMVQYENFKVKNMFRPWSYYTKVPRVAGFVTGTYVQVGSMGWFDLAAAQSIGAIKIFATSTNASFTYGQLVISYYIAFKSRR